MRSFDNLRGMFAGVTYAYVMLYILAVVYDIIEWGYVDMDDLLRYVVIVAIMYGITVLVMYTGNILIKGIKADVAALKKKGFRAKKTA